MNLYKFKRKTGVTFDAYSKYEAVIPTDRVPRTFSATVRIPEKLAHESAILGNYESIYLKGFAFGILSDGRVFYRYNDKDNGIADVINFDQKVEPGRLVGITVTDDAKNGVCTLYIDGKKVDAVTFEPGKIRKAFIYATCLGSEQRCANAICFCGEIFDCAVFSRVLTDAEVSSAASGTDLDDPDLIACWDASDKTGGVIKDLSPNGNDLLNNRENEDFIPEDKVPLPADFDYSFAILGDQQIISGYYLDDLHYFSDWLLENREKYKIACVLNTGDFTNFNTDKEWRALQKEYNVLLGRVPVFLVRGDHDLHWKFMYGEKTPEHVADGEGMFERYFKNARYLPEIEEYRENLTNSYKLLDVCQEKYLFLGLDKNPSDEVIEWANGVIAAHPDRRVVIVTHCYSHWNGKRLNVGDRGTPKLVNGEDLWNRLVRKHPNVTAVVSGHQYTTDVQWMKDVGDNGNTVNEVLVNPQGPYLDRDGALCMICLVCVNSKKRTAQVRYVSALRRQFYRAYDQFEISLDDPNENHPITKYFYKEKT